MIDDSKYTSLSQTNEIIRQEPYQRSRKNQKILNELISSVNFRRIFKKVNTSINDLQFITFSQYLQKNDFSLSQDDYSGNYDGYQIELERRITQVKILLQMEHRYYDKLQLKVSPKKFSRVQKSTHKNTKFSYCKYKHQNNHLKEQNREKFQFNLEQQNDKHLKTKRSHISRQNNSLVSSRISGQHSNIQLQTFRKIKEVQVFQTYTQGRPYIEQYCNQLRNDIIKTDYQRSNNIQPPSSSRKRQCCSGMGNITQLHFNKKKTENQYHSSPSKYKYRTEATNKNKQPKDFCEEENQYDLIPLKNEKIKANISQQLQNIKQRKACKQLITQPKKYEEIDSHYVKKLKSSDKNDSLQREIFLKASSRQKVLKRNKIEGVKNRTQSKSFRKQIRQ